MSIENEESPFQRSHRRVCELISRFERHASDRFLQSVYQEAEARKDFIDPLLKALGWDVDHETQHNPYEQEVKVERSIRTARSNRRADYAFYLAPNFHDVRFFVEAKKPSVDVSRDSDAHFQTLRYGYSANTPLAILTDFEQIIVLDCRRRPHPDSALDQAWKSWHYTSFKDPTIFAEFYWLFSREAHADGSYQRRVDELPKPKGGAKQRGLFKGAYQPVDESFLYELEEWRSQLAQMFKKEDSTLTSVQLTEMVQRTLDRLVFLRFLEDKQIETDIRMVDFGKRRSVWLDFQEASKRLDSIYNGIVFKPIARLDEASFQIEDPSFGDICERLSSDNSPYNFDAIPIHILGSIYERFLGSVIRATAKRATVEPKPEVRKAGGVYYTPEYVVRHIVRNTVAKKIRGRSPSDIAKMRFADIACGSGSFLLGIYDELLRYHAEYYNLPGNEKKAKRDGCVLTEDGVWRLSLYQRRTVLLNNVFGVDIDRQAVEVAQLSLFLKLLEDERATSARQYQLDYARDRSLKTLLPDLSSNIVCGNSLIGWGPASKLKLDEDEERRLNPLDFNVEFKEIMRGGGFDAILGNPPYEVVEKERSAASWPHQDFVDAIKLSGGYEDALGGKLNLFRFFIVRAFDLSKVDGSVGMIVPLSLAADISCRRTRVRLVKELRPVSLDCFPQKDNAKRRVFRDAKLSTMIFVGARSGSESGADIRLSVYPWNSFHDAPKRAAIDLEDIAKLDPENIPIPLVSEAEWKICKKIHSVPGVLRLGDVDGVRVTRGEINQTIYRKFISSDPRLARMIKGVEVGRYKLNKKLSQGEREWFDEASYLKVGSPKGVVQAERIATQRITGVDEERRIVATRIAPPAYFADSTNSLVTTDAAPFSNDYLLALLNSKLMQWRFRLTSTNNNVGTNELECLPVVIPSKVQESEISAAVRAIIAENAKEVIVSEHSKDLSRRKIESNDEIIDHLVYKVYGLTPEEVKEIDRC
ncbi:N-6 DNA methylase [Stenotrophomonas maltophilia]|uniref:Eco57I restriction-modification methylase domain-containing protein n=1 Tax=Stenotrophomonas maltophilia TaxID=40324 RepID=UPI00131342B6|nr:DNA methyltransferase [Stenotrophomonas maltophilia]MBN4998078.1 type I restriction enzyme HsdR N-terminal domain-containing protein [Stenotrophomonas maltophilia]MCO7502095.1 N-6 DNA methylase [Stenotrophomonas maltophilia]